MRIGLVLAEIVHHLPDRSNQHIWTLDVYMASVGQAVYNGAQVAIKQNLDKVFSAFRGESVQVAYTFSKFESSGGDNLSGSSLGYDFQQAALYKGPSPLDRRHQISFAGMMETKWGPRILFSGRFSSPAPSLLTMAVPSGNPLATPGEIFRTDFRGDGTPGDIFPPKTKAGPFGSPGDLRSAISTYNSTQAGQVTPAGLALVTAQLLTSSQLATLKGVKPFVVQPPTGQVTNPWFKSLDAAVSWPLRVRESIMPFDGGVVEIRFDFIAHTLIIETSRGGPRVISLKPQSVADFYQQFMSALAELGIGAKIWTMPVEIPGPIAFERDRVHESYDAEAVGKFWSILAWVDEVFKEFRSRFLGKVSPVHFWWGSFDLAVTRFSGRTAPERPGADRVTREAYSHEVSSAGFWPGGGGMSGPAFYSYAAPEPPGFAEQSVRPAAAFYHPELKEFLLMYDDVRKAESPRASLLDFLQSTYEAAANQGKWDRKALER